MQWSEWPQWLAIFWLALPIISWPIARLLAESKKTTAEWIGTYLGKVSGAAFLAYLLYAGGFWG